MLRNEQGPKWQMETPLSLTIQETIPVGSVLTDAIKAKDDDGVSDGTSQIELLGLKHSFSYY